MGFDVITNGAPTKSPAAPTLAVDKTNGILYVGGANGFKTNQKSTADALTALAGGAQVGATAITADISRFTTVVTAADSAILPVSTAGMALTVINATANSMNVFPAVGETINALTANTAIAVAAGKTVMFVCPVAGKFYSLLTA